jgi:[acyl-carrier-protein] S-malonyltransferase
MHTALIFPGQGSQQEEMAETIEAHRPDLGAALRSRLGEDAAARVVEGTIYQQPVIYCTSLALYEARGCPDADVFTGHSLGEISALTAAGALGAEDGLRLVCERARLMQAAGERTAGGLLAVIGSRSGAHALAAEIGLEIANDNAPEQLVLAGSPAALGRAQQAAPTFSLRTVRLPVSGAFHSTAMISARAEFAAILREVEIRDARLPVYSCITARPFQDVRRELVDALTSPVRWRETVSTLHLAGVREFVEIGPGRILSGLVRRTLAPRRAPRAQQGVLLDA